MTETGKTAKNMMRPKAVEYGQCRFPIRWALLCALLFSTCVSAGDLEQELQVIFEAQSAAQSMESAFVQTKNLSLFDETITSSGTIVIEKPDFYCWAYEIPERSLFYVDGDRSGSYDPASGIREELDLDNRTGLAAIIQSVTAIITGNLQAATQSDFDISRLSNSEGQDAFTFKPRTEELQALFSEVIIRFDAKNKLAQELQIVEHNGDTTHMAFENWRTNVAVDRPGLLKQDK